MPGLAAKTTSVEVRVGGLEVYSLDMDKGEESQEQLRGSQTERLRDQIIGTLRTPLFYPRGLQNTCSPPGKRLEVPSLRKLIISRGEIKKKNTLRQMKMAI